MYTPHRDERFEYAHEVIEFIEDAQCGTCAFRSRTDEPMCGSIASAILLEQTLEVLDDRGDDGVVCIKYRDADLHEQAHPDQGRLF